MQTTIQITGLQIYGFHGLFDEERRLGQHFIFDIKAAIQAMLTHTDDSLQASVRYDNIIETVVRIAGKTQFHTLEALGESIARGLLGQFVLIMDVSVGVSKLSPPIPQTVGKVGITVSLSRAELADADMGTLAGTTA